jgi:hypothetical protein
LQQLQAVGERELSHVIDDGDIRFLSNGWRCRLKSSDENLEWISRMMEIVGVATFSHRFDC